MAALVIVAAGLLALRLLLGGRVRRPPRPRYRYSGMLLLVGVPGSGKSYKMVDLFVRRLAEGRRVLVNWNVRFDRVYVALQRRYGLSAEEARAALGRIAFLDTFEDLLNAVECDVFIDEAQDFLSSADWHLFPHDVVQWFAQHRHRGCRVVLASHRWGSIHNYIRELVTDVQLARPAPWYARALMMLTARGRPMLQYVTVKEPTEAMGASGPSLTRQRSPLVSLSVTVLDPLIASCYDSWGGVRESPMARLRRERAKPGDLVVLPPRRTRHDVTVPADGLPALTYDEHVDAVRRGVGASELLRDRWAVHGLMPA